MSHNKFNQSANSPQNDKASREILRQDSLGAVNDAESLNNKKPASCFDANTDKSSSSREQTPSSIKDGSDWIAEVSHELRLPIANLKLLVETLLDGALSDEAVARLMLTRASQEVDRLERLVVNLLSVEQAGSSGQQSFIPLSEAVRYAIDSTSRLAQSKHIAVNTKIEPDFMIYANSEQLDQVMLNLVENAIKFTQHGGMVTVRQGERPGSFCVEDTGVGMEREEIPKIFRRFYRVDRTRSRGSTGLGLSIVKHIADLHGAKITVTSEVGAGSVFMLEFPGSP